MKILVTGGAGFIGSHTSQSLLEKNHEVICLDNLDDYYDIENKKRNLEILNEYDGFKFVKGDIRNENLVNDLVSQVDAVNHQAAQAGVRISVENPKKPNSININGTLNLLEASRKHDIEHFLFASSSSVYGKSPVPYKEDNEKLPVSPYGVSKLAAESYVRVYREIHGLDSVSLRYFTVYGPRMRPDLAISIFTKKALNNKTIKIFGDGEQTRDFTYIKDIINAQQKSLKNKMNGEYNIGSGERITINKLANKIKEITNSDSDIIHTDRRKGDAEHTWADTIKAKKELGWQPKYNLEEGLKKFIEWYKMQVS